MRTEQMTCAVLVVVVLCVGMLPTQTTAFSILSERNNLVQSNNATIFSNKTIAVLFEKTDFGVVFVFTVLGTDGVTRGLNLQMPAVARDYTGSEWGLIPAIANLHISENCNVQNTIRYNSSLPQYLLQQPTGRQLQSFLDTLSTAFSTFTCTGGFGYLQSFASAGLAAAAAAGDNYCGGGGVNQDQVGVLSGDLDKLRNRTINLENAQAALFGNITNLFGDITATNQQFILFQSAQLTANAALQSQINQTTMAIGVLTTALAAQTNSILNDIAQTNQNIINLAAVVATQFTGVTAQLANYVVQFMGLVNATNVRLANLTSIVNSNQATNVQVMRSLARNTRNLATNLQQYILNTGTIVAQTQNLQTYIKQDLAGGIFKPFLDDLGTAPLGTPQNLGQFASLMMSPVAKAYTWINPADGQPWAAITVPKLTCSSLYLVTNPFTAVTTQDIQEFIGPAGCSSSTEGSRYCNCWIQWQEQMCPIVRSSSGVANPATYAAFRAALKPTAMNIDPSFCQGGAGSIVNTGPLSTPRGLDGVVSNALDGYINSTVFYASRGTCQNSLGGAACNQSGYSGWDNAGRIYDQIDWDVRTTTYGQGFTDSTYGSGVNLYTTDLYVFQQAYQFVLTYIDTYQETVFGSPPDDVSQVYIPFRRDPVRHAPMSCSRWSYVSYGSDPSDFIKVQVMRPIGIRASVIVTVDGNPNIQSTFVLSNPDTNLLPDYQAMVGDFLSTTVQYNPPSSEIVISPDSFSRSGKLTYAIVGALVDFSITVWQTVNQAIFNHEAAGNFAAQYENGVDGVTGFCIPINTPNITVFNGGNWCALREKFIVSPDPGHNLVSYFGREDQAIAELVVPEGIITQLQQSACPQVVGNVLASDGSSLLTLQNLLSGNTPNVITYTILSSCTEITNTISINPLSTNNLIIPFCPLNAPGQVSTVYFFFANGPILTQCPQILNITASLSTIGSTNIAGSLQMTETLRTKGDDLQLMALSSIITQQNTLLFQLNQQVATIATYVPIPQPEFFIGNNSAFNDQIISIQGASQAIINATKLQGVNYTNLVEPFLQQIAVDQAAFAQAQADAIAAHNRAAILVNKTAADLIITTAAMFNYLNASVEFFDANLAFDAQVLSIFQSQVSKGGNMDFIGDFFNAIADLGSDALKAVLSIPKAVADFFATSLGAFLNSIGGAILAFLTLGLAALGAVLGLYSVCKPQVPITSGGGGGGGGQGVTLIKTNGTRQKVTFKTLQNENDELREMIYELQVKCGMNPKPRQQAMLRLKPSEGGNDSDLDLEDSQ